MNSTSSARPGINIAVNSFHGVLDGTHVELSSPQFNRLCQFLDLG